MYQLKKYSKYTLPVIASIVLLPSITLAVTKLSVPFTSQAPEKNWSQPWQDACEEATILMVDRFYSGGTLDKSSAKSGLLQLFSIKNNHFGYSLDENAQKITELINHFLPWEAHIVENPTLEQLKAEIDAKRPIILPAHGRALYNKYFRNGGPDYHTVVISGYDDETQEFITQEPGTKHGLDFRYSYDTILNAMHDHLPGQTIHGDKVAIFTTKKLNGSKNTDQDKDGLSKIEEIEHGTVLWLADSDGDSYLDGQEVSAGFSPTLAESQLPDGSLIKSTDDPKVYLIENGQKRHILSEQIFLEHGWQWSEIKIVSEKYLQNLVTNNPINQ